ncbi:putative JmjC domain-containing histone demethylation protein 2C [Platysternon megacephalum]|uniref:Putative JmjC domain-containing histone demethylation protein 2C n=1 Tax=Platysternon megacephalum TaxID=55544 RepID=A0A4D9ENH4_9SAUR|nr:putative JmjC domain-containing histone demethylation protein 2C [Platysternon megacephalum]
MEVPLSTILWRMSPLPAQQLASSRELSGLALWDISRAVFSLKEPQCTISCPLRKWGGNQQQKAENFNSNIQSPENIVIVSDLKQLCQCGWSTPFDRVNILLFPILMFFRFSTCK